MIFFSSSRNFIVDSTFLLIKKNYRLKQKPKPTRRWENWLNIRSLTWYGCVWSREHIVRAVRGGRSFFTVDWDKALLSDWHESSSSVTASWRVASSYLFNHISPPVYNTVLQNSWTKNNISMAHLVEAARLLPGMLF